MAAGDLAALTVGIEKAKSELNQRMTVLGEREHDLAAAAAALAGARSQLAALTGDQAASTARLNHRTQGPGRA